MPKAIVCQKEVMTENVFHKLYFNLNKSGMFLSMDIIICSYQLFLRKLRN